jgi:hypothetical protein
MSGDLYPRMRGTTLCIVRGQQEADLTVTETQLFRL